MKAKLIERTRAEVIADDPPFSDQDIIWMADRKRRANKRSGKPNASLSLLIFPLLIPFLFFGNTREPKDLYSSEESSSCSNGKFVSNRELYAELRKIRRELEYLRRWKI